MSIRCPNFADPETRRDFNELLDRLGGRPLRAGESPREYAASLDRAQRSAWHRAHFYFSKHPTPKAIHSFLDSLEDVEQELRSQPSTKSGRGAFSREAALPAHAGQAPIRNARDFVAAEDRPVAPLIHGWRDVEDSLERMRAVRQLDTWRATQLVARAKEAGLTREDNEAIALHMDDPRRPLTPKQQALYDEFIKPMADELGWGPGYIHREAVGKGGFLDRLKQGTQRAFGIGLLRTTHPGMRGRVMKVITDEAGNRTVVSIKNAGARTKTVTAWRNGAPSDIGTMHFETNQDLLRERLEPLEKAETDLQRELKILTATKSREAAARERIANIKGKLAQIQEQKDYTHEEFGHGVLNGWRFKKGGKLYTIGEAHISEVEQHSGVRYHKNAIGIVARQYITERQAARQAAMLEQMKAAMVESGIAVKDGMAPPTYKPVDLANFRGYSFEPHTAEVLNHFAALQKGNRLPFLGPLNDILTKAMFSVLSVWHDFNIANQWIVERGASSWALPQGYMRLWKTLGPAIKDVMTISPEYQRLMAKGVAFKRLAALQPDAYRAIIESVANEFETKPEASRIAQVLGYGPKKIAGVLRWWGRHQQTSMWTFNDITALQAIKERMLQGESEDDAIRHVYEVMPDYRMRTDIRTLNMIAHPDVTWFSKWHYGLFRSWGQMILNLLGKVPMEDRARAADQLAMIGILAFVVYPALDAAWQKQTGNRNAAVHRFGMTAIPYDLYKFAEGQKSLTNLLLATLTPARASEEVLEQIFNRDFYTGKEIRPYYESAKNKAEGTAKHMAGAFLPLQEILQEKVNPENVVTSQLGLTNPPSEEERMRKGLENWQRERILKKRYWYERWQREHGQ